MKKALLLLCISGLCFFVHAQDSAVLQKIICYDGRNNIFPASWLGKGIRAKATAADKVKFNADTAAVIKAFNLYPNSVLAQELGSVYIVGKLKFGGQFFTGTNSSTDIYIGSNDNHDIEKTFHHEFSSILLRNHPDLVMEMSWKSKSPELFSSSSAAAVKAGYSAVDLDPALLEKGYLSRYSLSNWENDFNIYVENIFAGGQAFWSLVNKYPKVQDKVKLVIRFYKEKVWGGYSEEFFRAAE